MTALVEHDALLTTDTLAKQFVVALQQNDLSTADTALCAMGRDVPVALWKPIGELHVARQRWDEAVRAFDQVPSRDTGTELRRMLSINMSALQTKRPRVYAKLAALPGAAPYEIYQASQTKLTVVHRSPDGKLTGMSPGNDPTLGVQRAMESIRPAFLRGDTIGLCGVGDGYVLTTMARVTPQTACDMPQVVCIFEPDVRAVLACLMIHDYSGANGPIEQDRFFWFVGADFDRELADHIMTDSMAAFPMSVVHQCLDPQSVQQRVQAVYARVTSADQRRKDQVEAYYATHTPGKIAELMGPNSSRKPRVMLLTTRFSTVLQYSTRDAADGFRAIGWDAHVLIEPTPLHRLNRHAIRETIHRFRPDVVLQIDHQRHEHRDLFPDNLPFVCWIQDHLMNLTSVESGRKVGSLDFVLTGARGMYVRDYEYPSEQIIDLVQLATAPVLPARWTSDGHDLVYLSNWSRSIDAVIDEVQTCVAEAQQHRAIFRVAVDAMKDVYARGLSLPTRHSVEQLVLNMEDDIGPRLPSRHVRSVLVNVLFDRVNNALYRKQSLDWVIDFSEQEKLSLGLYGRGWDQHARYAPFARGSVKPGSPAQDLIRRSKLNLMLEPYPAHLHARMITGLLAGGAFLVRHNPFNDVGQMLLNFVNAHAPGADNTASALWKTPLHLRGQLDALLLKSRGLAIHGDQVETVRCWQRAGVLVPQEQALPRLDEISFANPKELREKGLRMLADSAKRSDISTEQRQNIATRLTYEQGLKRVVNEVRIKIARLAPVSQIAA